MNSQLKQIYMKDLFIIYIEQQLAKVQERIAQQQDLRPKFIGSTVRIWDGSANEDAKTGEQRAGIDPLFEQEGVVIQIDCNKIHKHFEWEYIMDLLIEFPTGEQVYCSSEMVQRKALPKMDKIS